VPDSAVRREIFVEQTQKRVSSLCQERYLRFMASMCTPMISEYAAPDGAGISLGTDFLQILLRRRRWASPQSSAAGKDNLRQIFGQKDRAVF